MSARGDFAVLIGRRVLFVSGATLYLDTGEAISLRLEGDCCSSSSFTTEGLAALSELVGATVLDVEERSNEELERVRVEQYPPSESDSWHFLVFTTDKGHVTVDWRNESNGYYDGWLEIDVAEPLPPVVHDALLEGRPDALLLAVSP